MSTTIQHTTNYKNSPLGLIPEDWEVKELNEIGVNVIDGDRGKNYPSENEFTSSGYCVFLNAKNVTNQGFAFIDINFITEEKDKELRKGKLFKYDIVLTTRGTIGNISFFDESVKYENLRINSGMVLIRNTKTELIENNFLYKCFTSYVLQQQIDKVSFGSAQPQLTVKEINKFKLPIPPFPEQVVIAGCLSTWDKAIEKQNELIAKKELSKKALMQQLLSGKKRLKGFSGHWKDIELGDLLAYEQPTKYLVKDTMYNYAYSTPVLTAGKTFILGYTNEQTGICNELPVVIFDDFTTSSKFVNFPFKAKSSAMKLLRPKSNTNLKFIYEAMQFLNYTVGGHERHWISKFVYLTIPCPSLEEQIAIAKILQCADDEIQLLKKKLDQLKEQKKGLMQVLLTGKKRLKIKHTSHK